MQPPIYRSAELRPHWLICSAMLAMLAAYNVFCHFWADAYRLNVDESQRVVIRTVFYVLAIIVFPLTNLMRHILLRLNQTMPGEKSAADRYLLTIVITQSMIEVIALFGPIMFILGDDFNTLYIFSVLGTLGAVLHRPKPDEYLSIVESLSRGRD